jgi:hypothetical protein
MLLFLNLIEISFIPVPEVSDDPDERTACVNHSALFPQNIRNWLNLEQWLKRVETLRARETTARGV